MAPSTLLLLVVLIPLVSCNMDLGDGDIHYEAGYVSDWDPQNGEWQQVLTGRSQAPKCIDIPQDLSLCRDMRYTRMRLPNLLDHDTLEEVIEQAKSWVPLLGIRCHPDTQVFLCSLFSPVCLERKIWPCRNLCEAVKAGCEDRMLKYGFPWPDMLRCEKFPLENLCIGLQNDLKPDETVCPACSKPNTVEGIVDSYCEADFAVRMKIRGDVIMHDDLKLTSFDKKRMYKKGGNLKKRDYRGEAEFHIENGASCECSRIESSNRKLSYLAMGKKSADNKLMITFITVFNQKDADLKKALRAIRKKSNICEGGVQALAVRDQPRQERTRGRKRKKSSREDGQRDRKKGEGENKKSRNKGNRNRDRGRSSNEARKLDLGPSVLF